MADLAFSIGTKILEYLVEPVLIRPLRPIFCFKSIVDDFRKEHKKLILAQVKVKDAVKEAKDNALEIYEQVDKWVEEANAVMEDAQSLQNKLEENKSCCLSSGWTCHYRLSKQAWEVTDSMKKLSEIAGSLNQVARPVDLRQHIGLPFSEDFVVSKSADSAFREITEALMKDDVNKIGLYGTGGVGKTTLAKQVFKEAERLRMFDRVVMVIVPHTIEAIKSIQDTIADFLNLELKQRSKEGRASQLYHRLTNGEKILIIFDDVCEELDLAAIGIPPSGCCKVLLATSYLRVCNSMQTQRDIQLGVWSEDEAWVLFKSIAGVGDQLRMLDEAKKVIMFCNGLPKALVIVGRALRGKSHSQWEETLQKLKDDEFKIITDDLHKETEKLSLRKERVLNEIKAANNNSQVIEKDVEMWLTDVEKVMEDVEKLKGELNQDSICLGAWDDMWSKKATLQRAIVQKLYDEGTFDRVAHPAAISQDMGLSLSKDFIPSKSATLAFREIMKALMKDDVNVIGLYGMGGIGKTTLAKQVANEAERLKTFDRVVMVTVSQTPEVRRIQGVIADFLNLKLNQESEEGRASQLSQRLMSEKIFVILDDVWKKFDLANIGIFGDECKSCKILSTTRRRYVCTSMDSQINIRLNLLSEDEAWDLFKKKALLPDDFKLNDVAKQVVRECKCLPIALATVGAALRNKNADEWKEALEKLRDARLVDIPEVGDDEKNAYKCLRLSYDYLKHSSESQAQFLLLLCSLFPEDHEIDMEDLTRCAYGMELFQRVHSIGDARRKVRVTVQFLKDSSLLLDTDNKERIKMHDVVRDVALWIGGTECPEKSVFTVRDETDLKDLMKKDIFQTCRAVSFMSDSIHELLNYELAFPKLETMFIFGANSKFIRLPDAFFKHVEALKVLDIRCQGKWTFSVPQSLKYLRNVRTLNLIYCESSNCCMLGELRNLEILSLRFSKIEYGFEALFDLKHLRLLDECVIPFSDDERSNGCNLSDLNATESLCNLREVQILNCSKLECFFSSVSFARNLQQLEILHIEKCDDLEAVISSSAPNEDFSGCFQKLRRLDVSFCRKLKSVYLISTRAPLILHLPKLLLQLKENAELEYVVGHQSERLQQMDPSFPQWPSLRVLRVYSCPKLSSYFRQSQLQSAPEGVDELICSPLEYLSLYGLPNLNCIWSTGHAQNISFSYLTEILVWNCNSLKQLFTTSIARSLEQLQTLVINCCNELEQMIVMDGQEEEDVNVDNIDERSKTIVITFPSLASLKLRYLPSLVRFCPANYILNLPSLERRNLDLCQCPNTITDFFSSQQVTLEENGEEEVHTDYEQESSDSSD